METVLYADVLFAVNFSMDFISLAAAAALGGRRKKLPRLCIASALGALYGVAAIVSGVTGWLQYLLAAAVGLCMCVISFGLCGGAVPLLRQSLLVWGCGALLGGVMTATLSIGSRTLTPASLPPLAAAGAAIVYFIIRAIRIKRGCRSVAVTVTLRGKSVSFDALCDSGNLLRDPFSGKPVILTSSDAVAPLFCGDELEAMLSCDAEALSAAKLRIRLIPRKSSGQRMLCTAFIPDSVHIGSGRRHLDAGCLIAISRDPAKYYGGFDATLPYALIP